jgi:hypothetical protein
MGDLVFGRSFGTLGEKPENRRAIWLLGRAARRNYTVAAMPALASYGIEKYLPIFRGLFLDRAQYLHFGKSTVMARQKENGFGESGRRDIFSYLLHAQVSRSTALFWTTLTTSRILKLDQAFHCQSCSWKATL